MAFLEKNVVYMWLISITDKSLGCFRIKIAYEV